MINTANTIYVIQYDYDLNGITISIPENCILQFDGGSLSNGTITFNKTHITDGKFINIIPLGNINNTIAYAKWFESEDDTKVIHWLFTIAANNVQIELENKTYNIDTTNPNGYANGFIKIDNCNSFIINGNGAKIYDIIEYDTIDDKLYEFIRFTNCSYVNINNITYEWKYEAEIVDKVKGIIFIRTLGECKNFYLNFEVINVGRGLYSGSFNNTNIGRGFCDSIVKVKATKVGYPIAIEIGDNNDLFSTYENVHRGNYYCGLSNSKVHVKGKNPDGNMNLFRFVACKNTTMCFKYYDTPDLVALDATDSVPITNTVTGYTWRGSSCEFLKGGDFSNFTGKFDFSYITFVKNVSNISQFQIQAYGQEHSVETLIAILDGLIDTTASPKSQGVGNTYNLRKLQATEAGLAAIARAEAKGWTITSNV